MNHDREAPMSPPAFGWFDAIARWRPISIAPGLTTIAALIAYGCLFFLVLYYPLPSYPRPYGERRFFRRNTMCTWRPAMRPPGFCRA